MNDAIASKADGYLDCEGDLATRVRALVGPNATVGAEFDLHAHPTPALLAACDVMVYYKEYPHVDIKERARELFSLCE